MRFFGTRKRGRESQIDGHSSEEKRRRKQEIDEKKAGTLGFATATLFPNVEKIHTGAKNMSVSKFEPPILSFIVRLFNQAVVFRSVGTANSEFPIIL